MARFRRVSLLFTPVAMLSQPVLAQTGPVDPLAITVELDDAERFAALFRTSAGAPTAEALQAQYLDPAGRGVEIFTP